MQERHGRVLATFGRRLAAYVLDQVLLCLPLTVFFVTVVVGALFGLAGQHGDPLGFDDELFSELFLLFLLGSLVFIIGYGVWWVVALWHGKTPGKQLAGIRVIKGNAEPPSWCRMFIRELIKGLPAYIAFGFTGGTYLTGVGLAESLADNPVPMVAGIYWLVDHLWPLFDERSRAIHDKIAGTIVVRG